MSTPVRFRVLGPVSALRDGLALPLGAPRQRVVLAVLLLTAGHTASVDSLVDAVWGSGPPRTARASLRNSVSGLRAVLGEDVVVGADGGYALRVADFDLDEVNGLVASARGLADPVRRHAALAEAGRLWTGEPLAGLVGAFAQFQRSRLNDLNLTITENRLSLEVESGGGREVIEQLSRLCRLHPFREEPHRLLMSALHRAGRDRDAIAVYDALGERLAESLGIDPGAAVTELRERIRRQAAAAPMPVPAQLPASVAAFTGREELVRRLTAVLTAGRPPVAALSGFGGIGKTAVAVHVAQRLRHRFPDGQLYADLRGGEADPVSPDVVLGRFLRALGVPDPEIPDDTERRSALFGSVTVGKRVFMLLDNAADAAQVRPLLSIGRHGAVLVTGRKRLTELERVCLFDVDVLDPAEAFQLFRKVVGAQRVDADAEAATAVVAACGHLPLAVRIAASRALSRPRWPLTYLAERLADATHRLDELRDDDRSVAAAFALSYAHLSPDLAECFRSLAVIELPDFTLPEAVDLLRRPKPEVATDLAALVTLGLLGNPAPDRYQFHDLVRLFGAQRATEVERRTAVDRLVHHYLAVTVAAIDTAYPDRHRELCPAGDTPAPAVGFGDRGSAVEWLNSGSPRMLSTVRQAARCHPDAVGPAADLVYSIAYWAGTGSHRQNFIDTVTELAEAAGSRGDRAAELRARLALLRCLALWRPHQAERHGHRVLRLLEECGDDVLRAEAYSTLSDALVNVDRAESAHRVLEYRSRAIEYFDRTPGSDGRAALARSARALTLAALGQVDRALAEAAHSVTVLRGLADDGALVVGLFQHGLVLCRAGRFEAARSVFAESRDLANQLGDRPLKMLSLYNLARVHATDGDADYLTMIYATQAAALSTDLADDDKRARSLVILGRCLHRAGLPRQSRSVLTEALRIFERLDRPDAEEQRQLLRDLLDRDHPWPEAA